jgi:hypothetical protein
MNPGMKGNTITPAESAKAFVEILDKVDIAKTGDGIYSVDGNVFPW